MADKLFLETTEVPAERSLGEIVSVLVKAGAQSVSTKYDQGKPAGLSWSMRLYGVEVWFELPVKVEPVFQFLRKKSKRFVGAKETEQLRARAERVAWRQLLMWVKLQAAMIDLGMLEFGQVFLPYVKESASGATVWDVFREQRFKQLPPPEKQQ